MTCAADALAAAAGKGKGRGKVKGGINKSFIEMKYERDSKDVPRESSKTRREFSSEQCFQVELTTAPSVLQSDKQKPPHWIEARINNRCLQLRHALQH